MNIFNRIKAIWRSLKSLFVKRDAKIKLDNVGPGKLTIDHRIAVHKKACELLETGEKEELAHFFLGNIYHEASYTGQKTRDGGITLANEIIEKNPEWVSEVEKVALSLKHSSPRNFLAIVRNFSIDYLKIGMISEMSMIISPSMFPALNKRILFVLFHYHRKKMMTLIPTLTNWPTVKEDLIDWIFSNHSRWQKFYPTACHVLENIYQEHIVQNYPNKKWKYFYLESYVNYYYELHFPKEKLSGLLN